MQDVYSFAIPTGFDSSALQLSLDVYTALRISSASPAYSRSRHSVILSLCPSQLPGHLLIMANFSNNITSSPPRFVPTTITEHLDFGNPKSATMSPGSIYYLPSFSQIKWSRLTSREKSRLSRIANGVFGHPVLVLSVDDRREEASVMIITSSGGKPFESLRPDLQAYGVPIWPNNPHPINDSIMYLKNDWSLPKASYISTVQQYRIPCCIVMPLFDQLHGRQFALRDDSLAYIKWFSSSSSRAPSGTQSPTSTRSSSPASSLSSKSSDDGVPLSLFQSPATSHRRTGPLILYSPEKLFELRPATDLDPNLIPRLRTLDFDLLRSDRSTARQGGQQPLGCGTLSSVPTTPTKHTLDHLSDIPLPRCAPAWRTSITPSVSGHHRYVDIQELDLHFPTVSGSSLHGPSYVDAEELDSYFPTSRTSHTHSPWSALAPAFAPCTMINSWPSPLTALY